MNTPSKPGKRWKKHCFALIILSALFTNHSLYSQKALSCTEKIILAEGYFEAGLFGKIDALAIESCLGSGFSPEEVSRYYKLKILMYLYMDNDAAAKDLMFKLLRHNPEYPAKKGEDPAEFMALHDQFDTRPIGLAGFYAGINHMIPNQIGSDYGPQPDGTSEDLYFPAPDFKIGVFGEKFLTRRLSVLAGIAYSGRAYGLSQLFPIFDPNDNSKHLELTFTERQKWVDIPIQFAYNFGHQKKFKPFLYVGVMGHYLLNASLKNVQRNLEVLPQDKNLSSRIEQVTTDKIDLMGQVPLRNRMNLSYLAGAGIQFKIGHNYLVLDYQLSNMIVSVAHAENRYGNDQLLYTFGYVDDNFLQTTHSLSLGYKHVFYRPRLK